MPCIVPMPMDKTDKPLLVLWYKESQATVPIYSYDTRSGPFDQGVRWADTGYLGTRAFFRILSDPPTLVVEDVKVADQAVYTCRVDYKIRPSAITKVNLTVIVPPGPPLILNSSGHQLQEEVGPLEEGRHTQLTCRSAGGSPTPTLTWWRDGERLNQVGRFNGQSVESRISLEATRNLHGATLTCQALNNNITEPSSTSITIKVMLRPISVEIVGDVGTLSSGRPVELVCRAVGSRPPAHITWIKGNKQVTEVRHTVMNGGNVTTGSIILVPSRTDDGKRLTCRASNPEIPHSVLEDSVTLAVLYKPEVELALGPALDPDAIKQGDDVYFECTIHANPEVHRVSWFHNGELLETNRSAGLLISGTSLVLQKVRRERAGVYTCAAHNSEGQGSSNAVSLNIMFAPVCSTPSRRTQGVARMESAKVVCQVEAYPPQVNFTWRFNGSTEGGEAVPLQAIRNKGTSSMLNYTASLEQDYGTLLCWATNLIGVQREPCVIHLIPAGPPDAPRNCSIANQTSEALVVECSPGFDGGLPQHFQMEAWDENTLLSNTSSYAPEFVVRGLEAGMGVTLKVRASNNRGQSATVTLEADIMKVAEKRMGPPEEVLVPPVVGAVVGGVGAVLVLVVAGLVLTHYAHRARPQNRRQKSDPTPTLTNVYVGGGPDDETKAMAASGNPDVVRSTGGEDAGAEDLSAVGATRCMEAVAILQGNNVASVATTLPSARKGVEVEYVEVLAGVPGAPTSAIRRREEPVVYTSLAPQSYRADFLAGGHAAHMSQSMGAAREADRPSSGSPCMASTSSLHDLAGVLHPVRGHHAVPVMRRDDGVSVYGTLRRGGERLRGAELVGVAGPPHPRAVGTFLATSHQESAV